MDLWVIGGVVTSLMLMGLQEEYFQDRNVYSVPVLTYSGGDRERISLKRLYGETPRNPLLLSLNHGPRKTVRIMEGYYVSPFLIPFEGSRHGAYAPSFRNIYDSRGRIMEKYEYSCGDTAVTVEWYYRYAWNDRNQLTEYQSYDSRGSMMEWRKFTYDAQGQLAEEDFLPGETSRTKNVWTPEGRLLSRSMLLGRTWKPEYEAVYSRSRLLEERNLVAAYGEERTKIKYSWDAAGRLKEISYIQSEPPADLQKEILTRDSDGRVIQLDHYDKWAAGELYLTERLRFKQSPAGWMERLHFDPQGVLTATDRRTYDAGGRLIREDTDYPGQDYAGPVRRYTARYDAVGLPVEEVIWEYDSHQGKLIQTRKLLLGYEKDGSLNLWENWESYGDRLQVTERRRYFYAPDGSMVREECWTRDSTTEKPVLDWAYVFRYDGVLVRTAHPEGYPFMTYKGDYACMGPWDRDFQEAEPAYRFK